MSSLVIRTPPAGSDFGPLRDEFELPETFSAEVLAEAESAVLGSGERVEARQDFTDLPLVTIDPPGSKDLDQALSIQRLSDGFRVHYAIADLAAFVRPGSALDKEARRRGQTIYLPDGNVPLHPPVLSEGAASLLPGELRPAVLWSIDLDSSGDFTGVINVRRGQVRSAEQFDYETVQAQLKAGQLHPAIAALPEVGRLRRELAVQRGAVELQLPEQQIRADGVGGWELARRPRNDIELWNAEVSLLTGMAAAQIMLSAGIGILRTVPAPESEAIDWLRRSAHTLGIDWPETMSLAELLSTLDPTRPESLALYTDTTRLLRGAGYTSFDGELPELTTHAGIGGPYAHVTAPIRRLVDRFATEVCLNVSAGKQVPSWLREALGELPELMGASDSVSSKVDRACLDQVESWILAEHIGEVFDAVVLRAEESRAEIMVETPPVLAKCVGAKPPEGARIRARLTEVDVDRRWVLFERVLPDVG